ncbi:hypothetical protein [Nocardia arizonensis]|uniref:hypothetical protein n=1 Tax=Nocardia arizonensis TaxID=1141647 RepID=UPI0006D2C5B2|nr:hypothetical protein [Nocardia arizonensis]
MNDWAARTFVIEDYVGLAPGAPSESDGPPATAAGDPPPPWRSATRARRPLPSAIGCDGHPAHRSFPPPVDSPRRMFAGGRR